MKFRERMMEMIGNIKGLQGKSKFEDGFVTDLPPTEVEVLPIPTPTLGSEASTNHTLQKILNCIRDEGTHKIGIWRMGGVGKTTILKLSNNMPEIERMFDIVIFVTVSKGWGVKKFWGGVIKCEEELNGDAQYLKNKNNRKKYLLLLDDVWKLDVDFGSLALPSTNQDDGWKVVPTTRELGVYRRMGTDVEVEAEVLSEEEGWKIFHSKVGEVAMYPTIKPIAQDMVSYEQLKDTNTKNRFLYCGLYPENHEIKKSQLIEYWRAEGLLLTSGKTLEKARVEGHDLLQDLIDASLLEM
ncbi:hypothetical protein F0562_011747 [Nyssa sinensis]|uniref:Uncharacterized protein n=1 Tax=Nyssa sinensis TaxID=561372 RepID=A0A5J4ZRP0_9ASTE|nr:hypothetical protein F0562_011747 [Nyssa sinensis]